MSKVREKEMAVLTADTAITQQVSRKSEIAEAVPGARQSRSCCQKSHAVTSSRCMSAH